MDCPHHTDTVDVPSLCLLVLLITVTILIVAWLYYSYHIHGYSTRVINIRSVKQADQVCCYNCALIVEQIRSSNVQWHGTRYG